jgi:hypothetical protein
MRNQKPINGKFGLYAVFVRKDKRKRDLDNLFKGLLDILTEMHVIEDDSLMENITAEWAPNDGHFDCAVIVWIDSIPETMQTGEHDGKAKTGKAKTGKARKTLPRKSDI